MIHLSQGTASCLGLKKIRMDAAPTTAYLFYGEHCQMNCAFCPQASSNSTLAKVSDGMQRLGRVSWPSIAQQKLLDHLPRAAAGGMKRICIQGVKNAAGNEGLHHFIKQVKAVSTLPICVSAWTASEAEVAELFAAGAERVSIALDVVNPRAYTRFKKGSLQQRIKLLLHCARLWPGRISTHIIAGLTETEEECVVLMERLLQADVSVALFAFTPVIGTALANHPAPPLESYRRIQAALFLLQNRLITLSAMRFQEGRIQSYGLAETILQENLHDGVAFQTSGCPDCNRPYYNERPGGVMYNYPRPLSSAEIKEAMQCIINTKDVAHGRTMVGYQ